MKYFKITTTGVQEPQRLARYLNVMGFIVTRLEQTHDGKTIIVFATENIDAVSAEALVLDYNLGTWYSMINLSMDEFNSINGY